MEPATKTNTRTEQILNVMRVLAWIVFIGLMIEAGAILISYGVSWVNPDGAKNLYKGLDLHSIRDYSFRHYTISVFFLVIVLCMKAYVAFLAIKALSKVNLINPFKIEVAQILEKISSVLLGMAVIALLNNIESGWLLKKAGLALEEFAIGEYLFM